MEKSSDGTEPKEIKAYIYMKYENMLKVLAGGALKVRTIDECNDPYEFMPAGPEGEKWSKEYEMAFICFSSLYNSGAQFTHVRFRRDFKNNYGEHCFPIDRFLAKSSLARRLS